ncbi:MAG TPA: hypothetical protein VLI43_15180 [Gemmatimonadaceae bacterium]|nr:hypothetical protein [Gemmatimonadaceae bacterium]
MSHRIRIAFAVAAALVGASTLSASAATRSAASPAPGARADADSATGCLQKGDKPDTFKLVSKDGKSWNVTSTKLSLAGHVGHTVTLTGDTMKSQMSQMKDTSMSGMKMGDSSMSGMGSSGGTLNATSMKMVSATCS